MPNVTHGSNTTVNTTTSTALPPGWISTPSAPTGIDWGELFAVGQPAGPQTTMNLVDMRSKIPNKRKISSSEEMVCPCCDNLRPKELFIHAENKEAHPYVDFFHRVRCSMICKECFETSKHKYGPKESFLCSCCGVRRTKKSEKEGVCHSCYQAYYRTCAVCGDKTDNCSDYTDEDGSSRHICKSCVSKGTYSECLRCSNLFQGEDALCPSCKDVVFTCQSCGRIEDLPARLVVTSLYDKNEETTLQVCRDCSGYIITCETCGKRKSVHEADNYDSHYVCQECYAIKRGTSKKRKHNYTPAYYYYNGKDKDGLYFGVENEVTLMKYTDLGIPGNSHKIDRAMGTLMAAYGEKTLYFKHDGSIGGEPAHGSTGFEIVFQPHTFRELKTKDWYTMFSLGLRRDSTCGMHIHLTKSAFSTFHLFKFLKFIYENPEFVQKTGERLFTHHCTPNAVERTKVDAKVKKFKNKGPGESYRRQAVNLCNKNTVELRFFANADSERCFLKNIEFTHALFKFSMNCSAGDAVKTKEFVLFVVKNQKYYSNLFNFYMEKQMLPENWQGVSNVNA